MKKEIRALVIYRLNRSDESLEEALILLKKDHVNTFVNRLYYACFYAVTALLLSKGLSSSKHSGVRALFHQNFVKNELINREMGKFYDKLFDTRQKGDYADLVYFDKKEVGSWFDEAKIFISSIKNIIG
ncbi:MAG: HEPN domain-containing protein [Atribacterota bacterium]